jgi:DNA-binding response OmpR family regulator
MSEKAKQRVLSSGASDFVTKPFNNAEVALRVHPNR